MLPVISQGKDALALAGLVAGTLLVWHTRIAVPAARVEVFAGDLFHRWLPAYNLEAERLREWAVPLWNPYQEGGVPFLAMLEPGALYPARLLTLAVDVPTAMRWSTIGHVLLVVIASYVLCRQLGTTRTGAAAAGVIVAGTFAYPNIYMPHFLEAGAWLPVVALALLRVAAGGGWGRPIALGVAGAMPVLAGGSQMILYLLYGIALFGIALLGDAPRRGRLRRRRRDRAAAKHLEASLDGAAIEPAWPARAFHRARRPHARRTRVAARRGRPRSAPGEPAPHPGAAGHGTARVAAA